MKKLFWLMLALPLAMFAFGCGPAEDATDSTDSTDATGSDASLDVVIPPEASSDPMPPSDGDVPAEDANAPSDDGTGDDGAGDDGAGEPDAGAPKGGADDGPEIPDITPPDTNN